MSTSIEMLVRTCDARVSKECVQLMFVCSDNVHVQGYVCLSECACSREHVYWSWQMSNRAQTWMN